MRFFVAGHPLETTIENLIIAGWTGRDDAAVAHHIKELEEIGVSPPSETPLFYRVSNSLPTQSDTLEVLGNETSGEAEPFVLRHEGALYLGLGSDHTDRALEATSVAASKQACGKPCAPDIWPLPELTDRLDQLQLRSWIKEDERWVPYQDGTLSQILPLDVLVAQSGLADNSVMLCGTLPAIGGVRPAQDFRAELFDPATDRTITLSYRAEPLPIIA